MTGGSSTAHRVEDFSAPNVDTIDGVKVKRIPAGEAIGAHDLQRWSSNRSAAEAVRTRRSASGKSSTTGRPQRRSKFRLVRGQKLKGAPIRAVTIKEIEGIGWMIHYPDGRTVGTFEIRDDALRYVAVAR